MRKLQQMKQQEEEFDKHLAQTVPVSRFDIFGFYSENEIIILFLKKINFFL